MTYDGGYADAYALAPGAHFNWGPKRAFVPYEVGLGQCPLGGWGLGVRVGADTSVSVIRSYKDVRPLPYPYPCP